MGPFDPPTPVDYIGKHRQRDDHWPGSLVTEPGAGLTPPHVCSPGELVSDRHYNIYPKFALARAYLIQHEVSFWTACYERMQSAAGYPPRVPAFFELIERIRKGGFDPAHPIPVDVNYDVLDGTHRLAACLALGVFPVVQNFDRMAKRFGRDRLVAAIPEALHRVDAIRDELLAAHRRDRLIQVVANVWGVSLPLWDQILSFIGFGKLRRAFQRECTPSDYAKIIALAYAGDGISDKSLLRKLWTLTKFKCAVGVIAIEATQGEIAALKPLLRDHIVPLTTAYHYDSVIHTIDNDLHGASFLDALQPRKRVGDADHADDFSARLERFFQSTPSANAFLRTHEVGSDGVEMDLEASAAMQIRNRFKLVIFDLDGVLVDSERISVAAYLRILEGCGKGVPFDEAYAIFTGVSKQDGETILRSEFGIVLTPEQRMDKQTWIRAQRALLKPVPGIKELIGKISCEVCIASGSSPETIARSLRTIGFEGYFPEGRRFSASQVPRGKPAPDLFLRCAERVGVEPERCIVIEDSLPGLAAAKAAGMPFLWFSGAIHSEKYAHQVVHYAGVRNNPDAQALEQSLRDYALR